MTTVVSYLETLRSGSSSAVSYLSARSRTLLFHWPFWNMERSQRWGTSADLTQWMCTATHLARGPETLVPTRLIWWFMSWSFIGSGGLQLYYALHFVREFSGTQCSSVSQWCVLFISGITWVLVYRTDKYKRLKAEVEKQSKKRTCLFEIQIDTKTCLVPEPLTL